MSAAEKKRRKNRLLGISGKNWVEPSNVSRPWSWAGSPRNKEEARIAGSMLLLGTALANFLTGINNLAFGGKIVFESDVDSDSFSILYGFIVPVVLILLAYFLRRASERSIEYLPTLFCSIGALMAFIMGVGSGDYSVSGQFFYLLPQFYAIYALSRRAAFAMAFFVMALHATHLAMLRPDLQSMTEWFTLQAVILTMTHTLTKARDAQDLASAALEETVRLDPLTGVLRRVNFRKQIQAFIAGEKNNEAACLIGLDIDGFKQINKDHGQLNGNLVLQQTADVINNLIGSSDFCGRVGGDEFAVLLTSTSPSEGVEVARRLLTATRVRPIVLTDGSTINITASAGIAHFPTDAGNAKDLYRLADSALYFARSSGTDSCVTAFEMNQRNKGL